ncbi:MAG: efflux RND transporter periplasmic adaptor subunit [Mariprofundus sp.]|nr:efflux RND transporter periplasmic adaptor subunit [Mariprofundus sp.]
MIKIVLNLFTLAGLALLVACSAEQEVKTAPPLVAVVAHTATVATTTLPRNYHTSGAVSSDHKVAISSRISGYILSINVREGDRVQAGQRLFSVDPVELKQAAAQAKADQRDAAVDLKRYRSLLSDHAVSQQQFDKVFLRFTMARSRVLQAENQLLYAEVRAPVSGVVVEKHGSSGDLAIPGQPLLVLEDPSSLLVETYVSEQFITSIHENDSVNLFIPGLKKTVSGQVRQVVKSANRLSHQFLVKVALAADSGAYPGMFAEVLFVTGERLAVVVPKAALLKRSGLDGIYLLDEHHIAHYRQLRVGARRDGGVEILAGLKAGDQIVWRDDGSLRSGVRVKAQ